MIPRRMELLVKAEVEPAVMHALMRYAEFKGCPSISSAVVHILVRALSDLGYF